MKQKYGLLIATWILWFASILIPLLYSCLLYTSDAADE